MIRLIANTDIGSTSFTSRIQTKVVMIVDAAHEHREQRGDHAAEDDEREQEEQREREHLGARQVLLDLLADLRERELAAAGGHARLALHALLQLLGQRVVVGAGAEGGEQVGRAAVARDQLGRLAVADGDHVGDVGVAQRPAPRARSSARACGESTGAPSRTSTTMSGDAERPVARWTASRARTDSEPWSSKSSSESSSVTTGPP